MKRTYTLKARLGMTTLLPLLAACRLSVLSIQHTPPPDATITQGAGDACQGGAGQMELEGSNPSLGYANQRLSVPDVRFRGPVEFDAVADWNAQMQRLVVSYDTTGQPLGRYALVLRPDSEQELVIDDALNIIEGPSISAVLDAAICADNSQTQTITIRGRALTGASVSFTGTPAVTPLAVRSSAEGSELHIELPAQLERGGPYALTVTTPAGCSIRAPAPGVIVSGLPTVSAVTAGPRLPTLDQNGVPSASSAVVAGARVTVRLDGQDFAPGSRLFLGGVEAMSVVVPQAGTTLTATLPEGMLPAGTATVRVQLGACSVNAATQVTLQDPTLQLDRVNPTLVTASEIDSAIDMFGDWSAAAQGTRFFADVALDPTSQTYVELPYDAILDNVQHGARARVPEGLPEGGPYDVIVVSYAGNGTPLSGLLQERLTVSSAPAPRIVWKSADALPSAGGSFDVFGCGLAGAQFALLPLAGGDALPTSSTAQTSSAWAAARFRCARGQAVTHRVTLSTTAPSGIYRLRVTATVAGREASHDDLYPLVIYSATPSTRTVSAGPDTAIGRRGPAVTVAPDPFGRKYLYYAGGSARPSLQGSANGLTNTDQSSLEFAPLDPTSAITRWEQGPTGNWPLLALGPGGREQILPYGLQLVPDGPFIYAAGGAEDANTPSTIDRGFVLQTRVAHDTDYNVRVVSGPTFTADTLGVPTGTYHYRFAAYYPAADRSTGYVESVATRPLRVQVAAGSRVAFKVAAPCGPSGAGGYQGTPAIRVFRSSHSAIFPPDGTAYCLVGESAVSTTACSGSAEIMVEDSATFEQSDDCAAPAGYLYDFKAVGSAAGQGNYGAAAALVDGTLVIAGGYDQTNTLTSRMRFWPIADDGTPGPVSTTGLVAGDPAAFFALSADIDTYRWTLGNAQTEIQVFARDDLARTTIGLANVPNMFGFGAARASNMLFTFGGSNGSTAYADIWRVHLTSGNDVQQAHSLRRPRGMLGAAAAPPYVFVVGGVSTTMPTLSREVDVLEIR